MVYIGDDLITHSTWRSHGGVYKFSDKVDPKEERTIYETNFSDEMLSKNKGRLLNEHVNELVIIRPLNEIIANGYKLSESSVARLNYPYLDIEKISFNSKYDTVSIGNNITYTIKVTNKGTEKYNNVEVKDVIPENTTFVKIDSLGNRNGNSLNWNISVDPNETKTLSYTVKVNNDKNLIGKYITNNNTTVGGIKLNEINDLVGNTLSTKEQKELQDQLVSIKNKEYSSAYEMINQIYKDFGVSISSIDKTIAKYFTTGTIDNSTLSKYVSPINSDYFKGNKDTGIQTTYFLKKDLSVKDMYINGLYGGIYTVEENSSDFNELIRMRYLKPSDLTIGDVLIINDPDLKQMYLYGYDNSFVTVENNKIVKKTSKETAEILDSLLGQNNFLVLRPSLASEGRKESTKTSTKKNIKTSEIKVGDTASNLSIYSIVSGMLLIAIGITILVKNNKIDSKK